MSTMWGRDTNLEHLSKFDLVTLNIVYMSRKIHKITEPAIQSPIKLT